MRSSLISSRSTPLHGQRPAPVRLISGCLSYCSWFWVFFNYRQVLHTFNLRRLQIIWLKALASPSVKQQWSASPDRNVIAFESRCFPWCFNQNLVVDPQPRPVSPACATHLKRVPTCEFTNFDLQIDPWRVQRPTSFKPDSDFWFNFFD